MSQVVLIRTPPFLPFRFKRYFESKNNKIRIFGLCEVTGKNFEMIAPTEGFFVYLQGFKKIEEALKDISEEERCFILTGISPEGQKLETSIKKRV